MTINIEDHFGKPLPKEFLLPHEKRVQRFVDIATDQMRLLYPNVTFSTFNTTSIDIFQGSEARKSLDNWDDPEMKKATDNDPDLKKYLQELVQAGEQADIESATQARVECVTLGNNEKELEQALKKIKMLAAEKSGILVETEKGHNLLAKLAERAPNEGFESLSKEFKLISHFLFD